MAEYRRKATIRLPEFDYSSDGLYFVTMCVSDCKCHFGRVLDDQMQLNTYGEIAHRQWYWLLERYTYLESHAFQVMPNHIHGLLEINRGLIAENNRQLIENQDSNTAVGTGRDLSLQHVDRHVDRHGDGHGGPNEGPNLVPPTSNSQLLEQPIKIKPLDQLMGAYKTTVSKLIHLEGLVEFKWQRSYHEHMLRAEESYDRIIEYILSNPARWGEDEFYEP